MGRTKQKKTESLEKQTKNENCVTKNFAEHTFIF
jgi:hypothetical protein